MFVGASRRRTGRELANVGFSGAKRRRTLVRASPLRGDFVVPHSRPRPPTKVYGNSHSLWRGRRVRSGRDDAQLAPRWAAGLHTSSRKMRLPWGRRMRLRGLQSVARIAGNLPPQVSLHRDEALCTWSICAVRDGCQRQSRSFSGVAPWRLGARIASAGRPLFQRLCRCCVVAPLGGSFAQRALPNWAFQPTRSGVPPLPAGTGLICI